MVFVSTTPSVQGFYVTWSVGLCTMERKQSYFTGRTVWQRSPVLQHSVKPKAKCCLSLRKSSCSSIIPFFPRQLEGSLPTDRHVCGQRWASIKLGTKTLNILFLLTGGLLNLLEEKWQSNLLESNAMHILNKLYDLNKMCHFQEKTVIGKV